MNTLEPTLRMMRTLYETGFNIPYILETALPLVGTFAYYQLIAEREKEGRREPISDAERMLRSAEIVQGLAKQVGIHSSQLRAIYEESSMVDWHKPL